MTVVFRRIITAFAIVAGAGTAHAADNTATRFWNLTGTTITHLYMAPAGTTKWGADQCKNDRDGSVDFDERLRITDISSGHYDVKFSDKAGRSCIVKDVEVKTGLVFSIDKEMSDRCGRE
jgi:hypothetical protein